MYNIMIAMGSSKKREIKEQLNLEICHLRKGFEALTIDYRKGVLKTARGLLRIQKGYKTMVENNTRHVNFSLKGKNG